MELYVDEMWLSEWLSLKTPRRFRELEVSVHVLDSQETIELVLKALNKFSVSTLKLSAAHRDLVNLPVFLRELAKSDVSNCISHLILEAVDFSNASEELFNLLQKCSSTIRAFKLRGTRGILLDEGFWKCVSDWDKQALQEFQFDWCTSKNQVEIGRFFDSAGSSLWEVDLSFCNYEERLHQTVFQSLSKHRRTLIQLSINFSGILNNFSSAIEHFPNLCVLRIFVEKSMSETHFISLVETVGIIATLSTFRFSQTSFSSYGQQSVSAVVRHLLRLECLELESRPRGHPETDVGSILWSNFLQAKDFFLARLVLHLGISHLPELKNVLKTQSNLRELSLRLRLNPFDEFLKIFDIYPYLEKLHLELKNDMWLEPLCKALISHTNLVEVGFNCIGKKITSKSCQCILDLLSKNKVISSLILGYVEIDFAKSLFAALDSNIVLCRLWVSVWFHGPDEIDLSTIKNTSIASLHVLGGTAEDLQPFLMANRDAWLKQKTFILLRWLKARFSDLFEGNVVRMILEFIRDEFVQDLVFKHKSNWVSPD
eukprot:TRINITY_DN16319_c0_g1_i1.p1 TRINITY_DN16319_c0_g1~~TRINITY_DN16319_c0_g1_i1.p1  ORF type:complete len:542 (-),score=113.35 TRINITY_DN16319_c0_g1_i1:116-1741(-)